MTKLPGKQFIQLYEQRNKGKPIKAKNIKSIERTVERGLTRFPVSKEESVRQIRFNSLSQIGHTGQVSFILFGNLFPWIGSL